MSVALGLMSRTLLGLWVRPGMWTSLLLSNEPGLLLPRPPRDSMSPGHPALCSPAGSPADPPPRYPQGNGPRFFLPCLLFF